jgi:hypothetical protein
MAWRLEDSLVRGVLDNPAPGVIRGTLWLEGREDPLEVELQGNPQPDILGCRIEFHRRRGKACAAVDIPQGLGKGRVGHFTASRRVRTPQLPEQYCKDGVSDLSAALSEMGLAGVARLPSRWENALYIEWYVDRVNRVCIESVDFTLTISEPAWTPPPGIDPDSCLHPETAAELFEETLAEEWDATGFELDPHEQDMDEFQWESIFRENDQFTLKANELFEKYADHPDFDEILARELGWEPGDWEEEDEEHASGPSIVEVHHHSGGEDGSEDNTDADGEEENGFKPDPLREGLDWVRLPSGKVIHPLAAAIWHAAHDLCRWCTDHHIAEHHPDARQPLEDLATDLHDAAARCAGGLRHFVEGKAAAAQPGFVVARLKRSLHHLHHGLSCLGELEGLAAFPKEVTAPLRQQILQFRHSIHGLMTDYRQSGESPF